MQCATQQRNAECNTTQDLSVQHNTYNVGVIQQMYAGVTQHMYVGVTQHMYAGVIQHMYVGVTGMQRCHIQYNTVIKYTASTWKWRI
jgi:hypothetical protein